MIIEVSIPGRRYALAAGVVVCLTVWFLLTAGGLKSGYTPDDLMNLYRAVQPPLREIVDEILLFFRPSSTYRPAGTLFYRLIYEGFGFNPVPLRVACQALILANTILAFFLLRRLSGSWRAGAFAAALHLFHREFCWFYVNSGLCYDLLCFFFYTAAFLYYLRMRDAGTPVSLDRLAVWSGIYLLCLSSKEVAVSLPVMIALYELLHRPPAGWRGLPRWCWRDGRVALWGGVMTLAFLVGRLMGPATLTAMEAYRPVFRLGTLLDHEGHFFWLAFCRRGWMHPWVIAALVVALTGVALRYRLPALRLGLCWMLIGALPLAFIPQRGLDAVYIPTLGLALFAAAGLDALVRRNAHFGMLALLIVYSVSGRIDFDAMNRDTRLIHAIDAQLVQVLPKIPDQARVLVLRNPLAPHDWGMVQLMGLRFRQQRPTTFRLDLILSHWRPSEVADFDVVLDYDSNRLVTCDASLFQRVAVRDLANRPCRQTLEPVEFSIELRNRPLAGSEGSWTTSAVGSFWEAPPPLVARWAWAPRLRWRAGSTGPCAGRS